MLANPETLNPAPQTSNPTTHTHTLNPQPSTLNQEYYEWLETTKVRQEDISMWITVLSPNPFPSSSSVLFSSPELSDTRVHEPQLRALLGTASHFCEEVVLK